MFSKQSVVGPRLRGGNVAGDSSNLGVAGKAVCAGNRAQPGTLKSVQWKSHTKKGGLAVTLERKIFLWNVVGTEARFPVG